MITIEIKQGKDMLEKNKRAGFLSRIEKVATTDQLEKLAELSESPKLRKKLDDSFSTIKFMFG